MERTITSIWDWSATAASNTGTQPTGYGNGQAPSAVSAFFRNLLAFITEFSHSTVVAGTADALTLTLTNVPASLTDGMEIHCRAANANATTTPTFNLNSLGALTITKLGGSAVAAGDISANLHELILRYNAANTRWELLNPATIGASGITNNAVTNAKLAQMAAFTVKGNNTSGTANAADLTQTQAATMLGAAPVGAMRNLVGVKASNTTLTYTADEVIVDSALGGAPRRIASVNLTLNGATNGANGMDTGSQPTSGFLSVYLIFNPTTATAALLGTTASTSSIYGGANLPSGYTQSALIGLWPCGAGPAFAVGTQLDRHFDYQTPVNIITGATTPQTLTSQSVSTAVPTGAKTTDLIAGYTDTSAPIWIVAGDTTGTGVRYIFPGSTTAGFFGFQGGGTTLNVPILTAQTVFIATAAAATTGRLSVTGFSF